MIIEVDFNLIIITIQLQLTLDQLLFVICMIYFRYFFSLFLRVYRHNTINQY